MRFQWFSSDLPALFQCGQIMQINTGLSLGHHWLIASASVVPLSAECTCCSNGIPVCSNYANKRWIVTERPPGDVSASVVQYSLLSGIPVYWPNLVWGSLGQVFSLHATPYVYNWYGEGCLN